MSHHPRRPPVLKSLSSSSTTSASSVYSLRGMEQPVPSFRSFVRAVAPVPDNKKLLPSLPIRKRRSSSVYILRPSKQEQDESQIQSRLMYSQPSTKRRSNPELSKPVKEESHVLQPTVFSPKTSAKTPDLYFTPHRHTKRSSSKKDPTLLQPTTYSPQQPPCSNHSRQPSPRSAASTSPRLLKSHAQGSIVLSGKANTSLTATRTGTSSTPISAKRNSPLTSTLSDSVDQSTNALYKMTRDALNDHPRYSGGCRQSQGSSSSHQFRQEQRVSLANVGSQDKAKAALGIDSKTLIEEAKRRKLNVFSKLTAKSALQSHSIPPISAASLPSDDGQSRSSSLLSEMLDSYATDFVDPIPEKQLYAEDYHAMLNYQRKSERMASRRRSSADDVRVSPKPLFWKSTVSHKESTGKKLPGHSQVKGMHISSPLGIPPHSSTTTTTTSKSQSLTHRRRQSIDRHPQSYQSPTPSVPQIPKQCLFASSPLADLTPPQTKQRTLPSIFRFSSPKQTLEQQKQAFDHNRPIPRTPQPDRNRKLHAALQKTAEEMERGVEGARDIFRAIAEKGPTPERDDPFGARAAEGRERERERDREREGKERNGRGRQLHFFGGSSSNGGGGGKGSSSEKKREELKRRIRLVGEIDSHVVHEGVDGTDIA